MMLFAWPSHERRLSRLRPRELPRAIASHVFAGMSFLTRRSELQPLVQGVSNPSSRSSQLNLLSPLLESVRFKKNL